MNNLRDINMDDTMDLVDSVATKPALSQQQQRVGRTPRSRPARRSLSGAPLAGIIENNKFQHFRSFQKSQRDARGLNHLLAPVTGGPLYRSSLPVTPIATPIISQAIKFTEQSLHNRILMQSQLPRRGLFHQFGQPDIKEDLESQQTTTSGVPENDRLQPVAATAATTMTTSKLTQDEASRHRPDDNGGRRIDRADSNSSWLEPEKEKKQSRLSSTSSRLKGIFGSSKSKSPKQQQRTKNR